MQYHDILAAMNEWAKRNGSMPHRIFLTLVNGDILTGKVGQVTTYVNAEKQGVLMLEDTIGEPKFIPLSSIRLFIFGK